MNLSTRHRRIVKLAGIILLVSLVLYVGSYLHLSAAGRYEPQAIGLNGVKWYAWAPRGFVTNYRWNRIGIAYLPLYVLDTKMWHPADKAHSGQYPINEVKQEDIWKVYKALGL